MVDPRRQTPRTDDVLADPRLAAAMGHLGAGLVKEAVHAAQQKCRTGHLDPAAVADAALAALPHTASSLHSVINATGVVVHTNLGRAPLSPAAIEALQIAAGATDVELDLSTGQRCGRGRAATAALSTAVPDAEDVHVVNNGAAALALAACALAPGKEIVVARGELVEIGDGFRIPELLESVGARLREVGTTNRVRFDDYTQAVGADTGFVLKVHPSNFVISGFTSSVPVHELARLPAPVIADIGSGLLRRHHRLPDEPNAADTLRAGARLVTASGDKLLGGPQCGLVLGTADIVGRLARHPLARAMRVDKLTFAALEATLTGPTTPVARALDTDPKALRARAEHLSAELAEIAEVDPVESRATVGGGGAPDVELDSAAIALPQALAKPLRTGDPAVVGHVERGRLLLDLIAVDPGDDEAVLAAVRRAVDSA